MKKEDFQIGMEFYTAAGKWRCTDIGTRVIVAILLDQEDPRNYNGPPYSIPENVFDEYNLDGCSLDPEDFVCSTSLTALMDELSDKAEARGLIAAIQEGRLNAFVDESEIAAILGEPCLAIHRQADTLKSAEADCPERRLESA